jgi:hypothetical protein
MPSDPKPAEQKGSSGKLLAILALIAIVIIAVLLNQNRSKPVEEPHAKKTETAPPPAVAENQGANRPQPKETPVEEDHKEPESNAERAYLIEDFKDKAKDLSKYKMKGVRLSDEGIVLEDGATNGIVESPTLPLKLPSNMVALLWKEDRPDYTSIKPEMQLSYDGQNWSAWYPIESTGDDINPLYPNGEPNPNYGYVPGGYVSLGLDLVPFVRYRIGLERVASGNQTPTLKGIRMYHLDSAGKDGQMMKSIAQFPPGPPTLEEQKAQQAQVEGNPIISPDLPPKN